jgi:hypothetical protein
VFDPGYLSVSYDYYSRYSVSTVALAADVRDEHGPGWRSAAGMLESHRRVWLVRSHLFTESVLPRLERTFTRVWHQHFPKAKGIDVYLLAR